MQFTKTSKLEHTINDDEFNRTTTRRLIHDKELDQVKVAFDKVAAKSKITRFSTKRRA